MRVLLTFKYVKVESMPFGQLIAKFCLVQIELIVVLILKKQVVKSIKNLTISLLSIKILSKKSKTYLKFCKFWNNFVYIEIFL